jgi:hypothetical protein
MVHLIVIWYNLLSFGIFSCHLLYLVSPWLYFMALWYILLSFGIFSCHLLYLVVICYILW